MSEGYSKISETDVSPERLNARQLEVARLLANGFTFDEVGKRVSFGKCTGRVIYNYVRQLFTALNCRTTEEIATWFARTHHASNTRGEFNVQLTQPETRVLELLILGRADGSIAREMGVTVPAVRVQLKKVKDKIKAKDAMAGRTRAGMAAWYVWYMQVNK